MKAQLYAELLRVTVPETKLNKCLLLETAATIE